MSRRALHVEAALADARLQESADELQVYQRQIDDALADASSTEERARLRTLKYELEETAGAMRYSAVTGTDDSDLR